ncbi:hypothetical protein BDY19DRAFT_244750 [Irpex rosettiformis]|uniref:Uncharacterized protein n=1 Tax=Irpex rosettiformis TaxID=378272 RepID=A0ACB8TZ50_9APHY|nr:hypothetical protein BDY19DRAFT_244750 [Irpex rosettiformis]
MILPEPDGILSLTLLLDNPCNTTLVSQTGQTLYTVSTEHTKKATTTIVRNVDQEVVASLEWRDVRPDRVTFGNKKDISLADWMKKSILPFKDDLMFTDDEGRKYKWKGNSAGRSLELYSADDNFTSTIARFQPSHRIPPSQLIVNATSGPTDSTPTLVNPPASGRTSPILELAPRAVAIQDLVVTSFLFLEKSRRTNENSTVNVGRFIGLTSTC